MLRKDIFCAPREFVQCHRALVQLKTDTDDDGDNNNDNDTISLGILN